MSSVNVVSFNNGGEGSDTFAGSFKGKLNKCGKYVHKSGNCKGVFSKESLKDTSNNKTSYTLDCILRYCKSKVIWIKYPW